MDIIFRLLPGLFQAAGIQFVKFLVVIRDIKNFDQPP